MSLNTRLAPVYTAFVLAKAAHLAVAMAPAVIVTHHHPNTVIY